MIKEIINNFKHTDAYKNIIDSSPIMIYIGGSYTNMPFTVHTDHTDIDLIIISNNLSVSNILNFRYKQNDVFIDLIQTSIQNLLSINDMAGNDGIFKNSFITESNIIYENSKYKNLCNFLKTNLSLKNDMKKVGLFALFEVLLNIPYRYKTSTLTRILDAYKAGDTNCLHIYKKKTKYFASLYQYYCIYYDKQADLDIIRKLKIDEKMNMNELSVIINMLKDLKYKTIHEPFDFVHTATQWNDNLTKFANMEEMMNE